MWTHADYADMRYSNHLNVLGRTLAHGGWAGQWAMANLDTKTVGAFFSVAEDRHAVDIDYYGSIIRMLEAVTGSKFMSTSGG